METIFKDGWRGTTEDGNAYTRRSRHDKSLAGITQRRQKSFRREEGVKCEGMKRENSKQRRMEEQESGDEGGGV